MYIKQRFVRYLETKLGVQFQKEVQVKILNKDYRVVDGSIREHDYDDAWLLALGLHSDIIFDIGCNIGQSSLLLLYSDRVKQILLVDPNPAALSVAARNVIINKFSHKARFVSSFVADKCDRI